MDTRKWFTEDPDFTYIKTRKLLQKDLLLIKLTHPNKPLVGREARAMVYFNGVRTSLHPTVHINPIKAQGQLPWILRHDEEDNQSDEEADLVSDDSTALPVCPLPLLNHPLLVSQHDLAREDLQQSSDPDTSAKTQAQHRHGRGEPIQRRAVHRREDAQQTPESPQQSIIIQPTRRVYSAQG